MSSQSGQCTVVGLANLPTELIDSILTAYLDSSAWHAVSLTCRRLNLIGNKPLYHSVWYGGSEPDEYPYNPSAQTATGSYRYEPPEDRRFIGFSRIWNLRAFLRTVQKHPRLLSLVKHVNFLPQWGWIFRPETQQQLCSLLRRANMSVLYLYGPLIRTLAPAATFDSLIYLHIQHWWHDGHECDWRALRTICQMSSLRHLSLHVAQTLKFSHHDKASNFEGLENSFSGQSCVEDLEITTWVHEGAKLGYIMSLPKVLRSFSLCLKKSRLPIYDDLKTEMNDVQILLNKHRQSLRSLQIHTDHHAGQSCPANAQAHLIDQAKWS